MLPEISLVGHNDLVLSEDLVQLDGMINMQSFSFGFFFIILIFINDHLKVEISQQAVYLLKLGCQLAA